MKPQTTKEIIEEEFKINTFAMDRKTKKTFGWVDSQRANRKWIREDLNSARMKFLMNKIEISYFPNKTVPKLWKLYIKVCGKRKVCFDSWLVESVMSGVFDEIILKEGK